MANAYFFIFNALQYLCALEAKSFFRNEIDRTHLVILSHIPISCKQIENIMQKEEWDDIQYLPEYKAEKKSFQMLNYLKLCRHQKKFLEPYLTGMQKNDYLFIGNYKNDSLQWLLNKSRTVNKIVMDDGYANVAYNKPRRSLRIWITNTLVSFLFLSKPISKDTFSFFSFLPKETYPEIKSIQHHFEYVKSSYGSAHYAKKNCACFIGQGTIAEVLENKTYIRIVEELRQFFVSKGIDFEYYAHRVEKLDSLPEQWNAKKMSIPIEVHFLQEKAIPSYVLTFYSSASCTLKILFEELNVFSIQFPYEKIHPAFREYLKFIYAYISDHLNHQIAVLPYEAILDNTITLEQLDAGINNASQNREK